MATFYVIIKKGDFESLGPEYQKGIREAGGPHGLAEALRDVTIPYRTRSLFELSAVDRADMQDKENYVCFGVSGN